MPRSKFIRQNCNGDLTDEALPIPAAMGGIRFLITDQSRQSDAAPNKPRAFINVVFFDARPESSRFGKRFKSYDYRLSMVGSNGAVKDHYNELLLSEIIQNSIKILIRKQYWC